MMILPGFGFLFISVVHRNSYYGGNILLLTNILQVLSLDTIQVQVPGNMLRLIHSIFSNWRW